MNRESENRFCGAQRGFSIVTAIFLIVVLAGLGSCIVAVVTQQQATQVLDVSGSRAYQAARAGIEWGAFQSLRNGTCGGTTLTFAGTTLDGFTTTVTCTRTTANEAGNNINVDHYVSTARNHPLPCPGAPPGSYCVERQLSIVVSRDETP